MKKNQDSPNRPLYRVGLLGFVPLIGALVGTALILYGIFRYRDKRLILIGCFGILFTFGIYAFLIENTKHGAAAAQGFASIAQLELNNLVKQIEFYKFQNGRYPDSLEQLKPDGTFMIKDPLMTRKMDNSINENFNYFRFGLNYTIFSSGIDGIPHTTDDIYPDILKGDTSHKFGFIRR